MALAEDLLDHGGSVLLDSPCRYRELVDTGSRVAAGAGVRYGFIELWVRDSSVVLARLDARSPRPSQVASATAPAPGTDWELGTPEATLVAWQEQLVRPGDDWLRLDAEGPVKDDVETVLRYPDPDRR